MSIYGLMETSPWHETLIQTIRRHADLETWFDHLEIRIPELKVLSENAALERWGDLLEIGCGNGIGSAYFADRCSRVVASDLPLEDSKRHAIGLSKTKKLFKLLGLSNAEIIGCSAEALPFDTASFDTVLSVFSLEHLPNRLSSLKECYRVLRPGGRLIAAVPSSAWSFTYPMAFYSELFQRVVARVLRYSPKAVPSASTHIGTATRPVVVKDWASFRTSYPHFPFPEPHGEYKHYVEELLFQRPSKWKSLVQRSGFESVRVTAMGLLPRGLFNLLFGKSGLAVYNKLLPYDRDLCRYSWTLPFSQCLSVVAEK